MLPASDRKVIVVGYLLRKGAGRSVLRSMSKQVDVHQPFKHLFDRQCRSITHGLPSSTQGSDAQTSHDAGAQRSSSSVHRRAPSASHALAATAKALPEQLVLMNSPQAAWLAKPDAAESRQHAVPTSAISRIHRPASASAVASARTARCAETFARDFESSATQHSRVTAVSAGTSAAA